MVNILKILNSHANLRIIIGFAKSKTKLGSIMLTDRKYVNRIGAFGVVSVWKIRIRIV